MNTIEQQTCLQFSNRSDQSDYIEFTSFGEDGCTSYVGRQGGRQEVTLGPRCGNLGTILHELGHALGLWHEQTRPDRGRYVRILYDNIESENRRWFDK